MTIKCVQCGEEKEETKFPRSDSGNARRGIKFVEKRMDRCIACYGRRARAQIWLEVRKEFGGKCACCGEANSRFLTLDHINGDGNTERAKCNMHAGGYQMYMIAKREGYPKDKYQLLCFNCNLGRAGNGGICPHVDVSDEDFIATKVSVATHKMDRQRHYVKKEYSPLEKVMALLKAMKVAGFSDEEILKKLNMN